MASYWNPSPDFRYLLSESSERALMRFVVCTGGPVLFFTLVCGKKLFVKQNPYLCMGEEGVQTCCLV